MRTFRHLLSLPLLICASPCAWATGVDFGNVHSAVDGKSRQPPPVAKPVAPRNVGPITLVDGQLPERHILRAQILLDRAHFSPGEIDAGEGTNTTRAIAAFQRSRGLPDSGELDDATWAALDADSAPALDRYTITSADGSGPYVAIPGGMLAKARLKKLGYRSIDEMLGERFHSSPTLLHRLNPGKAFVAGNELLVPRVEAAPLQAPSHVLVLGDDYSVNLVDADGRIYARFPATYGSVHDPLPIGDWKIANVWRNPTYHYNPKLFWDSNPHGATATIQPGPNNPVGMVWMGLSKPHVGIHGTPEPSTISKTQSHGCIRLTNWSALQVASAVAASTPVMISKQMPSAAALRAATPAMAPPVEATSATPPPAPAPATEPMPPVGPVPAVAPAPATVPASAEPNVPAPPTDAMPQDPPGNQPVPPPPPAPSDEPDPIDTPPPGR